jgi:hypothetical protein
LQVQNQEKFLKRNFCVDVFIKFSLRFKALLQWVAKEIENLLALFPAFSESVMAAEENLLIHLGYRPRNFITRRSVLVTVWPGEKVDEKLSRKINAIFIVGPERTLEQDVEFAISQLVEIAVRALSPGIWRVRDLSLRLRATGLRCSNKSGGLPPAYRRIRLKTFGRLE